MAKGQQKPEVVPFFQIPDDNQEPSAGFDLNEYLLKNIRLSSNKGNSGVDGRVVVGFTVNEDGSLSDWKVTKSLNKECDSEAIRIVRGMPAWKPGKTDGKYVKVHIILPILFKY